MVFRMVFENESYYRCVGSFRKEYQGVRQTYTIKGTTSIKKLIEACNLVVRAL